MEEQDAHFRHILLYHFRKGKNALQAHKKLYAVYENEASKERQCQNWFAEFRSSDFSLKNAQRFGRPVEVDETNIKAIIDSDRHSTTREIAEKLNEIYLTQRISISDSLLKRKEIDPFLKRLITGDQKWMVYNEVNGKRSWLMQDEPRRHQKLRFAKKRLCDWDVLSHPPYSPDLASSDYHLFRSMQNSLNGKIFNDADDVKSHLIQFFAGKNQKLYGHGIVTLPERWQKIIDKKG
ncbi:histone-lysine N-methyltransferase SETMAR-like [Bombus flavifrons]|uniref:histone-lysine N-methyltransferase SETMAR-like n=1 Tax=Bombus flavifrons TaxID=103934 RepID=UPI003703EC97